MGTTSNDSQKDDGRFALFIKRSRVSLIIVLTFLITGCAAISAGEGRTISPGTKEVRETRWRVVGSDPYWNDTSLTIINNDELVIENTREDASMLAKATFSLDDSNEKDGLFKTDDVLKYELRFSTLEIDRYADDIARLQKGGFEMSESENDVVLSSHDAEVIAKFANVSENLLHLYQRDGFIEVVAINKANPAVFRAVLDSASVEEEKPPNVTVYYKKLHEHLKEKDLEGIENARIQLDELYKVMPDSRVTSLFRKLIETSRAYLAAVQKADAQAMTVHLNELSEIPYANLFGVVDDYTEMDETIRPYVKRIQKADEQMKAIEALTADKEYTAAEDRLKEIETLEDVFIAYYPKKSEELNSLKTRLEDTQHKVDRNDFNGYWESRDDRSTSNSGRDIIYISDDYFFYSPEGTDSSAVSQIESATLEGADLQLNIFEKETHQKKTATRTSLGIKMKKEAGAKKIVVAVDGRDTVFYPVSVEQVMHTTGLDIEEQGNEIYQ